MHAIYQHFYELKKVSHRENYKVSQKKLYFTTTSTSSKVKFFWDTLYSKGQLVFNSRFFQPNLGLIGNPRSVLESAHQDDSKTPPGSQN